MLHKLLIIKFFDMNKFYSLLATAMFAVSVNAQTTIYSESFGTPTATTSLATYTGYQNASPVSYSGTADVRISTPSSGYAGSTGGGNIFFTGTAGTNLVISGISTAGYESLALSFGELKSTSASSNELTVEVSDNGTTWVPLTYTRASGTGTANVYTLISPTGTIPTTATLSIKFTNTNTTQWRLDDVKITGTVKPLGTSDNNVNKASLVKNTIVENSILFAAKANVQVINMNGQVVRTASVNENSSVDVSTLTKGTYFVTGNVNGKTVSQKIIKK